MSIRKSRLGLMVLAQFVIVIVLVIGLNFNLAYASSADIRINVNGNVINSDTPPIIVGGRTLLPIKAVAESLGASVNWDGTNKSITIIRGNIKVCLQIDNKEATVNDANVSLDVPALVVSGRTMVPAKFIAEAFGANVGWDAGTKTVNISLAAITYIYGEIGKQYIDSVGMGVTVKSIIKTEKTGSIVYMIDYQLTNTTLDNKINEGTFKVLLNDGKYENQYGFFGTLFPGDTISRSYEFEFLKSNVPVMLEYEGNFLNETPFKETVKWKME